MRWRSAHSLRDSDADVFVTGSDGVCSTMDFHVRVGGHEVKFGPAGGRGRAELDPAATCSPRFLPGPAMLRVVQQRQRRDCDLSL